jgi:hypothetical protein
MCKDLGWTIETDFNNGIDELIEKMKEDLILTKF